MAEVPSRLKAALAERYRIERELGQGGMATVYLARDLKHDRDVAVKVLRPELAAALGAERFLREVKIAAQLQHPHILPLHDSGEADGVLYYVMPYVKGESLRERLAREGELPVSDAIRLLRDIVDALVHAHAQGVVHRDIKPDNVMLSGRHALVTDFGVAKAVSEATGRQPLTTVGVALGTPAYMAPEQASADPHIDHRADLYALGVVAYELLTGRTPFTGPTAQAMLAAQVTEVPTAVTARRPACPPGLGAVVMRCLEKKPADRWQSAEELLTQLEALATPTTLAPVPPLPERERGVGGEGISAPAPAAKARRRLVPIAVGGVLAVAVAAVWLGAGKKSKAPATIVADVATVPRLVVLPFENLGAPNDEYFADGITEEITAKLAGLRDLGVISRTSAMQYKKNKPAIKQIGQELGVQYVLEGTIRWDHSGKGPGRMRVTPQLIRVTDDQHLWANTYDGELANVFAVQTSIAGEVVKALGLALRGTASADDRPTSNLEAYDLYLRGNDAFFRGGARGFAVAIEAYQGAVKLDSSFALAYAALAGAYRDHWFFDPTDQQLDLAKQAADRAIALRPDLAEGYMALVRYHIARNDPARALGAFTVAESLTPNRSRAAQQGRMLYQALGDPAKAVQYAERAVMLDPKAASSYVALGAANMIVGRYSAAEQAVQRGLQLAPDAAISYQYLFYLYPLVGRGREAVSAIQSGISRLGDEAVLSLILVPQNFDWWYSRVLADDADWVTLLESLRPRAGGIDSAGVYLHRAVLWDRLGQRAKSSALYDSSRALFETKVLRSPNHSHYHAWLGVAYAGLGLKNQALREGRRAVELGPLSGNAYQGREKIFNLGLIFAMLGDREAAIDQFEQSTSGGFEYYRPILRVDPTLAPLRDSPRFRKLIEGK